MKDQRNRTGPCVCLLAIASQMNSYKKSNCPPLLLQNGKPDTWEHGITLNQNRLNCLNWKTHTHTHTVDEYWQECRPTWKRKSIVIGKRPSAWMNSTPSRIEKQKLNPSKVRFSLTWNSRSTTAGRLANLVILFGYRSSNSLIPN